MKTQSLLPSYSPYALMCTLSELTCGSFFAYRDIIYVKLENIQYQEKKRTNLCRCMALSLVRSHQDGRCNRLETQSILLPGEVVIETVILKPVID